MTMNRRELDEVLEYIWMSREGGDAAQEIAECDKLSTSDEELAELEAAGLIRRRGQQVEFTDRGEAEASDLVRRHRLAERLIVDILGPGGHEVQDAACEFEHVIAPRLTESICTLLGHPRKCPHGLPIPEGDCCREARRQVESVVVPLTALQVGEAAPLAYISTRDYPRLQKLISFGISPGVQIRVHQRFPTYVIQAEETQIALESQVARDIYLWRGRSEPKTAL
ncbi:MAG: metal-dependent transcriptional regulator [Acidobacteriota bacterium]